MQEVIKMYEKEFEDLGARKNTISDYLAELKAVMIWLLEDDPIVSWAWRSC